MRHVVIAALFLALIGSPAFGHGGQYKGPGDAGGPAGGSGGNAGPPTNPAGAGSPGPGAPTSGGPSTGPVTGGGGGRAAKAPTTGAGIVEDDGGYERWEFWWENNKDQYLNLKNRLVNVTSVSGSSGQLSGKGRAGEARSSRRASDQTIVSEVIPTLTNLLKTEENRDILDSAVLALGRVSRAEMADQVLQAAQPMLAHKELSVQTSATLSMGVLGSPKAINILTELMVNSSKGQQLVGGGDVQWLVRSFAALSLGLINDPSSVSQLVDIIQNTADSEKDIKVCAIVALGLMDNASAAEAHDFLLAKLEDRKLDAIIKSYIPTALAKMSGGKRTESVGKLLEVFKSKDTDHVVRQSCAIALGLMARLDQVEVVEALTDYIGEGKDAQTRHFCFMALADMGRRDKDHEQEHNDAHLALRELFGKELSKPDTKTNRSWAAMAAAIYAKEVKSAVPKLAELLTKAYEKESDKSFKSAYAVALGLLNHAPAANQILDDFTAEKDEEFRGYAAVALGFMNFKEAGDPLRNLCQSKTIAPTFRLQIATALGLMADAEAVHVLVETLKSAQTLGVSSAVAKALGLIGDQSAIEPLKAIAQDKSVGDITRAFACVALGIVCEKTELPWNARISQDNNYRGRVPAIDEILDIL
jgi:HEAT repeat protein